MAGYPESLCAIKLMLQILNTLKSKFLKNQASVGLDIGSSSVKLVKLNFLPETIELCACEFTDVKEDLGPCLRKMAEAYALESVNLSVSGQAIVTRYVIFPHMALQELRQSLKFEAQKYIPFDVNEVNLDACILKDNLADNKMLVLVAAAKKDFISQRIKIIEDAGLKCNLIDINAISIINSFLTNYAEDKAATLGTFALLNIGSQMSNLSIVDDSVPWLSRDIHIGGSLITRQMQEILQLAQNSAEDLKRGFDPVKYPKIVSIIEGMSSELAAELRTSFDYFESQSASSVKRMYLSGGSSRLFSLRELLATTLGIEVLPWDPLRKIIFQEGQDAQKLSQQSAYLAVAVGAALRR